MTDVQSGIDFKNSYRAINNLLAINPVLILPPGLRMDLITCSRIQGWRPKPIIMLPNLMHPEFRSPSPQGSNGLDMAQAQKQWLSQISSLLNSRMSSNSTDNRNGFFNVQPEFTNVTLLFKTLDLLLDLATKSKISIISPLLALSSGPFGGDSNKFYSEGEFFDCRTFSSVLLKQRLILFIIKYFRHSFPDLLVSSYCGDSICYRFKEDPVTCPSDCGAASLTATSLGAPTYIMIAIILTILIPSLAFKVFTRIADKSQYSTTPPFKSPTQRIESEGIGSSSKKNPFTKYSNLLDRRRGISSMDSTSSLNGTSKTTLPSIRRSELISQMSQSPRTGLFASPPMDSAHTSN